MLCCCDKLCCYVSVPILFQYDILRTGKYLLLQHVVFYTISNCILYHILIVFCFIEMSILLTYIGWVQKVFSKPFLFCVSRPFLPSLEVGPPKLNVNLAVNRQTGYSTKNTKWVEEVTCCSTVVWPSKKLNRSTIMWRKFDERILKVIFPEWERPDVRWAPDVWTSSARHVSVRPRVQPKPCGNASTVVTSVEWWQETKVLRTV